ncbi:MAG TPA: pyruvate kinase [bacterium]|jgi:pyruvate kinase|nr:pyruvate kinase [bacterium]HOG38532.1 pyruvate kinase [bacterium]HQI03402.1 pyruvate kinase [bacterium]
MKRTKIIATIGPASSDYKTLLEMAKSGMNVCRLNFSHNSHKSHLSLIKNINKVRRTLDIPLSIMQDLQGPKIRVGNVSDLGIKIEKNEKVVLIFEKIINYKLIVGSGNKIIPVSFPIHKIVKKNAKIMIHDGLLELRVSRIIKDVVWCDVVKGGIVFSFKGINVPNVNIEEKPLTKKDLNDLKFGLANGIDWVALSLVKSGKDIKDLKMAIRRYKKNANVKIMAKIETSEALKNINDIIKESDGIMVARGDLGVEVQVEKVPIIQKDLILKCLEFGKPVVVATQMLESMVKNIKPTRAEVSDVANAVIDHADAVMLSEETAFGKYPVETIKVMSKVIDITEKSVYDDSVIINSEEKPKNVLAISESVKGLVFNTEAKIIVVATNSGYSARMIARLRPETKIVALVNDKQVRRQLSVVWGIYSYEMPKCKNVEELIEKVVLFIKNKNLAKKGDFAIIVTGQPVGMKENMNLIELKKI